MNAIALDLNELPSFPRCLEFQTTNFCNAECTVCPYSTVTAFKARARMSNDLLDRILSECVEHRDDIDLLIPYLNNEPFADRRMISLLRRIKRELDVAVEISTNASLLNDTSISALVEEDLLSTIRISLFGSTKETYERRMKGLHWERTYRNISRLLDGWHRNGTKPRVELIMVASEDLTEEEVSSARSYWNRLGANLRVFGYLDRAGNNEARNLLPNHQGWGRLIGCDLNRPFERLAVTATGDVVLCSQDWNSDVVLGSLISKTITEVWHSETYNRVRGQIAGRRHAPVGFLCRQCKLAIVE